MEAIYQCLKRFSINIRNIVKRGYVSLAGDDSGPYNLTQISYSVPDKTANAEVINPYGLYSNLPNGIQVLFFAVNNDEENRACIGYSQDDRFKNLKEGEVLIGNPQTQAYVKFDADGNIEIQSAAEINIKASGEINIDAGDINIENGTINVTGDAELNANNVNVNATKVNLGSGGARIARLGDQVTVGASTGTITSAGTNTSI